MKEIIAAMIGGFLAAAMGWFLDRRREKERISGFRTLITTGIRDDLRHSISLYEKINEDWEKTETVWFTTLNELRESRKTYLNNKDSVVLFKDENLRKDIFRYYLQSADSINILEYEQHRKYEIERKINEVASQIRMNSPGMSQEDAIAQAKDYCHADYRELGGLNSSIPNHIDKLYQYKQTAENLLNRLENNK